MIGDATRYYRRGMRSAGLETLFQAAGPGAAEGRALLKSKAVCIHFGL